MGELIDTLLKLIGIGSIVKLLVHFTLLRMYENQSWKNARRCQELESVLNRLIRHPDSRAGRLHAEHLERRLRMKRYPPKNALTRVLRLMTSDAYMRDKYPSIRKSQQDMKSYYRETHRSITSDLSALLWARETEDYRSEIDFCFRYELAKACTIALDWLHVYHLRQLEGFITKSFILSRLKGLLMYGCKP